jgi:hypothetical protein
MQEKLAILYDLFKNFEAKDINHREINQNTKVTELITEILDVFGLPPTDEFLKILVEFGRAEVLTDDLIDETLIKLADEGVMYRVVSDLGKF